MSKSKKICLPDSLPNGVRKVPDGARKVSDGVGKVSDGVRKRSDGARKVSDILKDSWHAQSIF